MPLEQWIAFKKEYGKSYTPEEDAKRFEIFEENLVVVEEHNKRYERGEESFSKGLNQFSDWIPFTWAETSVTKAPVQPVPLERNLSVSSEKTYDETVNPKIRVANYNSAPEMGSEVSSYNSYFDMEMETRAPNYNDVEEGVEETVQLSVQVTTKSQYYQVQKPPIPKKPKRVAPQPSTFHIGSGIMRKRAEYET